jgi:uncharacterized protein
MLSIDANILLYGYSTASPHHDPAKRFIKEMATREDVALSEFVLAEFYLLLRNPVVLAKPLNAPDAVGVIQGYRRHPRWKTLGFPPAGRDIHSDLWSLAAKPNFARRRIYDIRTALSLLESGVTRFATANTKDFQGLGFKNVWNPLG